MVGMLLRSLSTARVKKPTHIQLEDADADTCGSARASQADKMAAAYVTGKQRGADLQGSPELV